MSNNWNRAATFSRLVTCPMWDRTNRSSGLNADNNSEYFHMKFFLLCKERVMITMAAKLKLYKILANE
jgi:hypothetical protein